MNAEELAARADSPPRTTDVIVADFIDAAANLALSAECWRNRSPDRAALATADATLCGLQRLLIELRARGGGDAAT